jgi:beta-N-acetylhexosaminidase
VRSPGSSTSIANPSTTLGQPATTAAACSNPEVLSGWSVGRRAAQLVVAPDLDFSPAAAQVAVNAGAGGIIFLGADRPPPNLAAQLRNLLAGSKNVPAPTFMADEEGGGVQRLEGPVPAIPYARDMARTMTPDQVRALATDVGRSMRQLGVAIDLAPVVDLDAGPGPSASNPDGARSFSADAAVTARYALAFSEGLRAGGVLPVVKHFPGLGGASGNTDHGPASTPPLTALESGGLQPFRASIAAGAPAVMVSNAVVPGLTDLPASLSADAVDGLLRHTLGFQGLVLTDSLSAGAISQAGYDVARAATTAIEAGADMILFGSTLTPAQTLLLSPANVASSIGGIVDAIDRAVSSGSLPVDRLNNAVEHVLAAKGVDLCAPAP